VPVEPAKGGALAGTGNSSASCRGRYGDFAAGTTGGEEEVKWIMPEKFFDVLTAHGACRGGTDAGRGGTLRPGAVSVTFAVKRIGPRSFAAI